MKDKDRDPFHHKDTKTQRKAKNLIKEESLRCVQDELCEESAPAQGKLRKGADLKKLCDPLCLRVFVVKMVLLFSVFHLC
jgi:hypothetical protein